MPGLDSYTKLLLHCNGSNGSTSFPDESASAHTVTPYGDAQVATAQSKFGGASAYLDGTGDYLSINDSSDFNFGTGNFTIDFWVRLSAITESALFTTTENTSIGFILRTNANGSVTILICDANGDNVEVNVTSSAGVLIANVWQHIAIVRNGTGVNEFNVYIDGISVIQTQYSTSSGDAGNVFHIGALVNLSWYINGYIDEFRVSKGIARWTSNFSFPIIDDSSIERTITPNGNAKINTNQYEFGDASVSFDGVGDYLSLSDSSDFDFGTNDFTIDLWIRVSSLRNYDPIFTTSQDNWTGWVLYVRSDGSIALVGGDGAGVWVVEMYTSILISANNWHHIAIVRYGTDIKIYVNGALGASSTYSTSAVDCGNLFHIGTWQYANWYLNGYLDEFRVSKGIARWTSTFSVPVAEYSDDSYTKLLLHGNTTIGNYVPIEEYSGDNESLTINENLGISDLWNLQTNPDTQSISDTFLLNDTWEILTNPELLGIDETIKFSDTWEILTNPELLDINETVKFSDTWVTDLSGLFKIGYDTILSTAFNSITKIATELRVGQIQFYKYATNLCTQVFSSYIVSTDLRVQALTFDTVQVGSLDNYIVKLDGVALNSIDIDFQSINITFNLNSNPSNAQFILPRRHDDLDHKLDGTVSTITNENKIEIYDGTIKLFTGYITEIFADSNRDIVNITAEDIRYKLAINSMELKYGGEWLQDSNNNGIADIDDTDHVAINDPVYIHFEKNIATALTEVLTAASGLISGFDSLPFSGNFVPEFVKSYNTYAVLIDELLQNTANANWYTDENERVKFQVVGSGQIKSLNLASLNVKRHPYDTIINDIRLNKKSSNYAKSLEVKLSNHTINKWNRSEFSGWLDSIPLFLQNLKDKTVFGFQQWGEVSPKFYVGINQTIYGYVSTDGWVLKPTIVIQWKATERNYEIDNITVGAGEPKKQIYLTSYGIKECNQKWEEKNRPHQVEGPGQTIYETETEEPWLTITTEESYNRIAFATDLANFELNQNNKLLTTANVSILLDAYEYYNIKFSDMINLSNTTQSNIYNNANGFPLNIQSVQLNLATRTVTLNLTNYGKTAYVKTSNFMNSYLPPSIRYYMKKMAVQQFSGL
jgi:hypothetical protein